MKTRLLIISSILMLSALPVFAQDSAAIASASMDSSNYSDRKNVVVYLSFTANRSFAIPAALTLSFFQFQNSIYVIQPQQKVGDDYVDMKPVGLIDNFPGIREVIIKKGESRKYDFSFGWLYGFNDGDFRVRMIICVSHQDKNEKDVFSNWVYFTYKENKK